MEATGASTTYNLGMLAFAASMLVLAVTMGAGGTLAFRRSRTSIERIFSMVGIAGGAAILATIVLAAVELLPGVAFWALVVLELGLLSFSFWVWMLVEAATKEPSTGNDKLVWVIIILFANVLGAVLYMIARRPQRMIEAGT